MSELTSSIIEIFRGEMGLEVVGPNDNFFDLGGDSLMAETTVLAVQQKFNVALQTSILLHAPTPSELAHEVSITRARQVWKSLVVPVAGCRGTKSAAMIHGMSGSALFANRFEHRFKSACRLFAVRGMGLEEGEATLDTIGEITQAYFDALKQVCGKSPDVYGGICLGGLVALEMARQNHERSEQRCKVILIDPPPLQSAWLKPIADDHMSEGRRKQMNRQAEFWRNLRDLLGSLDLGRTMLGRKARREAFKKSLTRALAGFAPKLFPCDILLIASSEWSETTIEGYRNWALDEASVMTVILAGNHDSFLAANRETIDMAIGDFLQESEAAHISKAQ